MATTLQQKHLSTGNPSRLPFFLNLKNKNTFAPALKKVLLVNDLKHFKHNTFLHDNKIQFYFKQKHHAMQKKFEELEKTITLLTSYIQNLSTTASEALSKVDTNFEKITTHLKSIDAEINTINAKLDKLELINAKLEKLDGSTTNNFNKVDGNLQELKTEIKKINNVTGYDALFENMKKIS